MKNQHKYYKNTKISLGDIKSKTLFKRQLNV